MAKACKTDVRVRKMTEADLPRIKEIDHVLVGPYRSASWPLRVEAHFWVYRGMANYVAEVDDQTVGFLMGDVRGTEYGAEVCAWIDILGVLPEFQSRGIGRCLVEAFCAECCNMGMRARTIVLRDPRLLKFWESTGFCKAELVILEK